MNGTEKRRTIYFVWNYLNWGGAQIYFLAIMKLARRDWDILVLLPKGSSHELLGFLAEIGVSYEFLNRALDNSPARSISQKLSRQVSRMRSEAEIFGRMSRVDVTNSVIHIEIAPWQSWQLLALLSLKGANVFITLHNFLSGGGRLRRWIWKIRTLFVPSEGNTCFRFKQDNEKERFRGIGFTN
jgi:hypothetical protein